ncbi:MAG TPA: HAMP domain-containing sensor histidine kinase [Anaeromyxobacteraceae bacterium]|nr:HAMP domain-containing sensor histidine kinase [Anaeromyxobacteraceae bacterium]
MSTLRASLLVPTVMLTGLVGGSLGWVAWDATITMNRLEREVASVRAANALALRLSQIVGERQRLVVAYRFTGDDELLRDIEAMDAQVEGVGGRIQPATLPPRGKRIWAQYEGMQALQERDLAKLVSAVRDRNPVRVAKAYERWSIAGRSVRALLSDFTGHSVRRLDAAVAELEGRRARSLLFLAGLLGASVIAVLGFRAYLGRRIVRPLVAMASTAARIARDREAIPVEGGGREDEIGVLARAFNQMTGDLVHANAKLGDALRVRDEFLSIASHELKTPLTSLRLQLELLSRRLGPNGPPQIAAARRQEERLEALISELLDVTRIRAGKFALRRGTVDLSALVGTVVERFASELERSRITLSTELAPGLVGHWDGERLDQVVTNLVSNAVKYAPGSPLQVRTSEADGVALIEVRDAGPGIPGSLRSRLFQPYQRASSVEGVGGLGLGLYIVREIVVAHGGEVRVESGEGQGTTFVVSLPRAEPAT